MCVGRREVVELALSVGVSNFSVSDLLEYLDIRFGGDLCSSSVLTSNVKLITSKIKKRWEAACRNKKTFLSSNSDWLNGNFCLPSPICQATTSKEESASTATGFSG